MYGVCVEGVDRCVCLVDRESGVSVGFVFRDTVLAFEKRIEVFSCIWAISLLSWFSCVGIPESPFIRPLRLQMKPPHVTAIFSN